MEIVVDAKVTAGPEGVAATEKEPDTKGGRGGGRGKADQSVDREEAGSTLATCLANRTTRVPFSHPSRHFSHFSPRRSPLPLPSCNTPRILPLPHSPAVLAFAFVFTFSPFSCPASQRCPPALRSVWNTFYCYRPKKRSWIRFALYRVYAIYIYIGESNRTTGGGKLVFFLFYLFVTNSISP